MRDDALAELDACALAALIARGDVSAAEVLDATLRRLDALNPSLGAVVFDWREQARERLRAAPTGAFAGVPFLLKDIGQDLAGLPATLGSRALRATCAAQDAALVRRWTSAGLLVLGKTSVPEFGLKAVTESALFGPCRNPWNLRLSPGGSSGGAAAAVAARIVPAAGASDGGGSIRIPAAYCGLVGLKPSRGRVSDAPLAGELWDGAVCSHALTRSVRDSAALLDVACGAEPGDPYQAAAPRRRYLDEVGADCGVLRIGVTAESPLGGAVHPEMRAAVNAAAELLQQLGHRVEPAAPRIDGAALARAYLTMVYGQTAALLRWCRDVHGARDIDFELDTRALAALGESLPAAAYALQRQQWNAFARALAAFHGEYDLLLTPTTAQPAPAIGELDTPPAQRAALRALLALGLGGLLRRSGAVDELAQRSLARTPFTQLANLTGTPAISLPLHWGADGMPIGVQLHTAWGREDLLLRVAAQLETARPWQHRRPPLPATED
jgi:amidase